MKTVNELIKEIRTLHSHLHEKDFLLTWEQSPDELKQVLDVAAALKALRAENIATRVFKSGWAFRCSAITPPAPASPMPRR